MANPPHLTAAASGHTIKTCSTALGDAKMARFEIIEMFNPHRFEIVQVSPTYCLVQGSWETKEQAEQYIQEAAENV